MTLDLKKVNLFDKHSHYYICHLIGGDYVCDRSEMGRRLCESEFIDFELNRRFPKKYKRDGSIDYSRYVGKCLRTGRVYNLVAKERWKDRAELMDIYHCLVDLRRQLEYNKIDHVIMPMIGCKYDGLDWHDVESQIALAFGDSDIDILVSVRY